MPSDWRSTRLRLMESAGLLGIDQIDAPREADPLQSAETEPARANATF